MAICICLSKFPVSFYFLYFSLVFLGFYYFQPTSVSCFWVPQHTFVPTVQLCVSCANVCYTATTYLCTVFPFVVNSFLVVIFLWLCCALYVCDIIMFSPCRFTQCKIINAFANKLNSSSMY